LSICTPYSKPTWEIAASMDTKRLMEDYTPGPVVMQGVAALRDTLLLDPCTVLDPSAGSGIFGQVFKHVWPKAHRVGVEPKRGEAWYLRNNYDKYALQKFEDFEDEGTRYDLVCTNPPFHSWEAFVQKGLAMAAPGGWVVLLGLTSWGSRSTSGAALFKRHLPIAQLRIMGAVSYRTKGNDTRDYCWWIFQNSTPEDERSSSWIALNLPRLAGSDRKW